MLIGGGGMEEKKEYLPPLSYPHLPFDIQWFCQRSIGYKIGDY